MCEGCLHSNHSNPHLHVFEKWMNGTFIGYQCENSVWCSVKHKHCPNKYHKDLVVIDDKGRQHLRTIEFCACEEEPVTLLDFNLWPSSPMYPKIAFHFDLLRWLNGLMLESHVSAKSFCEALTARLPKHQKKYTSKEEKEIYKVLMEETINQFRHFCYKMDFCERFEGLDNGCSCPACYQTDTPFYCLDADFQLVRKTSSGKSWLDPKHSEHFFVEQDKVDDFVSSYEEKTSYTKTKDCSNFQAGDTLRSKNKNAKLSEKAVFGATCRHDFPQKFFSLKHGERLGYAIFLLEMFKEQHSGKSVHISYDIACILKKHLEKTGNKELLQSFTFSVPVFHSYGHTASCQMIMSPRQTLGNGLTDGEGIERLWSYLGHFSCITKEMTPENRTDLLTDALIHYGQKIREKQGTRVEKFWDVLVRKYERATDLMETNQRALDDMLETFE
ncbi:uncharacterized protein LOC134278551, partial [Saccostrea cucullata]|uniref:uncharacterized protein LOC134278551 n=1 Tax=Saccostrea cuccullata TaxID=36930 RepID=UPI002ED2E4C6